MATCILVELSPLLSSLHWLSIMLTGRLAVFIWRMRKVDLPICSWVVKVWEEIPSDIFKRAFLKCCISNNMDGTEDNIISEKEAENDGDGDRNLLDPDSEKELRAVFGRCHTLTI